MPWSWPSWPRWTPGGGHSESGASRKDWCGITAGAAGKATAFSIAEFKETPEYGAPPSFQGHFF